MKSFEYYGVTFTVTNTHYKGYRLLADFAELACQDYDLCGCEAGVIELARREYAPLGRLTSQGKNFKNFYKNS